MVFHGEPEASQGDLKIGTLNPNLYEKVDNNFCDFYGKCLNGTWNES